MSVPRFGVGASRVASRLILVLFATSVVLGAAGFVYMQRQFAAARQAAEAELRAIAELKADQIRAWRSERLEDARFFAQADFATRDIARLLAAPDDVVRRAEVGRWLELLKGGDRYVSVHVLDAGLSVIPVASDVPAPELVPARRQAIVDALHLGEPAISELHLDEPSGDIRISLAIPIRSRGATGSPSDERPDRAIAAILLEIDPRRFLYPLIQSWPTPSLTAETLLIRRDGDYVLFLNDLRHRSETALRMRMPLNQGNSIAVRTFRGEAGVTRDVDYRGVPVVAQGLQISGTSWHIVAKVDEAELFADLRQQAVISGMVGGALLLSGAIGIVVLWRRRDTEWLTRELAVAQMHREQSERYAHLMRNASDIVLLSDADGRIREANNAAVQAYGWTLDELTARSLRDLRTPEALAALEQAPSNLHEGASVSFETTHRRKDGTTFPVEVSAQLIELDGVDIIFTVARDITGRRQIEEALRSSEERLRLALEAAQMGTFDWEIQENRITWSRWNEELWGFAPGELGGTYEAFLGRFPAADRAEINAVVARCMATRVPFAHDFRVVWPDDSVHWVAGTGEFTFDSEGRAVRLRGVVQEVTARRRDEERLQAYGERLRALTARLENLRETERTRLARELHDEMGQILTGLKMDLRWIERDLEARDSAADRALLDRIVAATELADTAILIVQRIATELRPSVLDKLGLTVALRRECSEFGRRSGLECRFAVEGAEPAPPAEAATALYRISQEALTNVARHAHASGVEVRLGIRAMDPGDAGGPLVSTCFLEVRDNGVGLPPDRLALASSLGLLGMQERARQFGGEVVFIQPAGGGTIVQATVPIEPPEHLPNTP